jgi:hypothetical protein
MRLRRLLLSAGLLFAGALPACAQRAGYSVASIGTSSLVVASGSGSLANLHIAIGATSGWLMLFDATALPSNGATNTTRGSGNLIFCQPVLSNGTTGGVTYAWGTNALTFNQGLVAAFSSTACASLTAATAGYIAAQVLQ